MLGKKKIALLYLAVTAVALLLIAAAVFVREYLYLKKIRTALQNSTQTTQSAPTAREPVARSLEAPLVSQISRSGGVIRARADFAAFKKKVEANPELLQQWGSIYWKILDDIPALCIRALAESSPFRALGAQAGDCITHIDGETVNQPLRNMAIWMSLPARSQITIDTLRAAKKISYVLSRR